MMTPAKDRYNPVCLFSIEDDCYVAKMISAPNGGWTPCEDDATPSTSHRTVYRVYFNRCEDWPQVWSIDDGDSAHEMNVVGFELRSGVTAVGRRVDALLGVDRAREPVAWLSVTAGRLVLVAGIAIFEP